MTKKEYTEAEVRLIIDGAIAEEREACAKVLDEMADEAERDHEPSGYVRYYREKAAAIRARGLHNMNKEAEKNGEEL